MTRAASAPCRVRRTRRALAEGTLVAFVAADRADTGRDAVRARARVLDCHVDLADNPPLDPPMAWSAAPGGPCGPDPTERPTLPRYGWALSRLRQEALVSHLRSGAQA